MNGQQRSSKTKVNGKWWRFENSHCGRWAVSTTPSDTFFLASLFPRWISESVKPSDSYPETPTSSTPPTKSTSSSSSSIFASVPASISHTPPTSIGPYGPLTGLSSPLCPATFSSGTTTGEGETAAQTWLSVRLGRTNLLQQDDAFFRQTSKLNSKNAVNRLLHDEFTI